MRKLIVCLLVLCIPVMVAAEDLALEKGDQSVITLGLKGGVGLPQLSSALDTTFYVHLEAAYQFPFWGSRLGLITSLGYTQPTGSGSGTDCIRPPSSMILPCAHHIHDFVSIFQSIYGFCEYQGN